VRKKVFVMFANNHHNDGRLAVWIPAPPGAQAMLVSTWPEKFFYPPYVGVRGWVGIELDRIGDAELLTHVHQAWRLVAPKETESLGQRLGPKRSRGGRGVAPAGGDWLANFQGERPRTVQEDVKPVGRPSRAVTQSWTDFV
jgi:hypothetical protein